MGYTGGATTEQEKQQRLKAVHHVVHEYANVVSSAEMVKTGLDINRVACESLYKELKDTWREFRKGLVGGPFEDGFTKKINERKELYPNGQLSEFRHYDFGLR